MRMKTNATTSKCDKFNVKFVEQDEIAKIREKIVSKRLFSVFDTKK
jgi:hypothetical protein